MDKVAAQPEGNSGCSRLALRQQYGDGQGRGLGGGAGPGRRGWAWETGRGLGGGAEPG